MDIIREKIRNLEKFTESDDLDYMESCDLDIYESLLKESVKRCPSVHTIFMLNRLYNVKTVEDNQEFTDILDNIVNDTSLENDIRNVAGDFMKYHS